MAVSRLPPMAGGINELEGYENSLEIIALARFAVDEHNNKKNSAVQFGKVVNARHQVVAGTMYYLTIEATDGGAKKVYGAKVWEQPWLDSKKLHEFKLIGEAGSSEASFAWR